ncbi:hypothetical protein IQ283_08925 (plasmid) [Alkalihalobacillus hwajinpoensis]|uniref:hypothetical protein n=1 Tax=Guptibacillus hwajinpoensis TaxID=208199 RepID=UPI0018842B35|nr:hypothetical protein [Pseudalkalibacillus hwajinpoensis]MBF0706729.1 hypothetical protein [Pseudalkalibacillus hwajinpoensis]
MLSKDFMSSMSNETRMKTFYINMNQQYYFRRTYFLLDANLYVEMVTLVMESTRQIGKRSKVETEVVESDSREVSTTNISKSFIEYLKVEDTIIEEYKLSKNQADIVLNKYKNNLFDVNKELLDSIN